MFKEHGTLMERILLFLKHNLLETQREHWHSTIMKEKSYPELSTNSESKK